MAGPDQWRSRLTFQVAIAAGWTGARLLGVWLGAPALCTDGKHADQHRRVARWLLPVDMANRVLLHRREERCSHADTFPGRRAL